ncbi:PHP domain-containing protein [Clostridium frigidicarnis]|uniref:PHP domain-containing protein n=1 Tax=Clostridium frigidicarnis TaxID=84698 RepID=A0A1I0W8V3_9CLOT|nr:PHP domain-containing protein [Clostridium frigidicarnis]SFA85165.1 hypothetical protein SAMN04488528_1004149 [Clostridium frigidicarnis]
MIIDTHVHENKYSKDSFISLDEITLRANELGLHGVCITDHESNDLRRDIGSSFYRNETLVIVGAEFLTFEGDILVFGLETLPSKKIPAKELLNLVKENNGVAVSAHPYRNNNRGLGDNIGALKDLLHGVECFNGSTFPHANLLAYSKSTEMNLGCLGASDSHVIEKLGTYATNFRSNIRDEKDFIEAIKSKVYCPVIRKNTGFENINIYNTLT